MNGRVETRPYKNEPIPMAYCSLTDVEKKETQSQVILLTDDAATGAVDMAHLTEAITNADGMIDAILRGHVSPLPIDPVVAIIKDISVELTIYNLYLRRFGANMPDGLSTRKKDAMALLNGIAAGKISLSDEQQGQQSEASVKVRAQERMFPRSVLDQF